MNILLLGSGGREHALAWKITQSPLCSKLFVAPGNAGTSLCAKNVPIGINDFPAIREFCLSEKIEMVIVGPEEPLVKGIVDFFEADDSLKSIPVIGPNADAAKLEGSKAFAKNFMRRYNIPTATYHEFNQENYNEGIPYLQKHALPIVIKADGLAAGKGVIICQSHVEAISEYELIIQQNKFGDAGKKVVVEEFLTGIEVSVFVLTDGTNYVVFPEAKDYKRIGEGDRGYNTGGMGAVSPVPFADKSFMKKIEDRIIRPTINGLKEDGIVYRGFIFIGVIKIENDPFVIEYNCRLGDPETEVVIPRLKNDLVELFNATANGQLAGIDIETDPRSACTLMAVSGGYPGNYENGYVISGLKDKLPDETIIFHSGTAIRDEEVVTAGGRVLCVTSFGDTIDEAVTRSKQVLQHVQFEDMYYRRDIGYEFI